MLPCFCSLESLLLSAFEPLFDALEVALEEGVSLQIEVIPVEPLALLIPAVELLEVAVLNVGTAVFQDENETCDEGTLTHRVGERLDQIPTEPRDVVDGIVAEEELNGEEAC